MDNNNLLDKPLFALTAREFLELLAQNLPAPAPITEKDYSDEGKYVYGLAGIAELFGCSKTTANRIKQSGKLGNATVQIGNKIITNAELALKNIGELKGKKVKPRK